jgi:hypothetical protein
VYALVHVKSDRDGVACEEVSADEGRRRARAYFLDITFLSGCGCGCVGWLKATVRKGARFLEVVEKKGTNVIEYIFVYPPSHSIASTWAPGGVWLWHTQILTLVFFKNQEIEILISS